MNPIDKALEVRKSRHLKAKVPRRAFYNRVKRAQSVLELVEKAKTDQSVKYEARRNFLVSLCAAFETYWRDFIRETIDRNEPPSKRIRHLRKTSFTLSDVMTIVGRKLTLGELMASAYSFQSTSDVNLAVSHLLDIDAFSEFSRAKYEIKEVVPKRDSLKRKPLVETFAGARILGHTARIDRCFEIRHETVHHTGSRYRVTARQVVEFHGSMSTFNLFFSLFIEKRAAKIWGTGD